jgi:hypothetical protein
VPVPGALAAVGARARTDDQGGDRRETAILTDLMKGA